MTRTELFSVSHSLIPFLRAVPCRCNLSSVSCCSFRFMVTLVVRQSLLFLLKLFLSHSLFFHITLLAFQNVLNEIINMCSKNGVSSCLLMPSRELGPPKEDISRSEAAEM